MLSITPRAIAVARRVTAHPSMTPTSGLRIAERRDAAAPLQVAAVHGPQPGDSTLERDGAVVYIGPGALERLEDRELDAVTEPGGRVQFVLRAAA